MKLSTNQGQKIYIDFEKEADMDHWYRKVLTAQGFAKEPLKQYR